MISIASGIRPHSNKLILITVFTQTFLTLMANKLGQGDITIIIHQHKMGTEK